MPVMLVYLEGLVLEVLVGWRSTSGWMARLASTLLMVAEAGIRIWIVLPSAAFVTVDTGQIERGERVRLSGSGLCVTLLPEPGGPVTIVQDAPITPMAVPWTWG